MNIVPISRLYFAQKLTLSLRLCPRNAPCPDIISQKRKEQSIFAIAFEAVELRHKVSAEQRVRLPLGHIRRKMLPLLEFMPIAHQRRSTKIEKHILSFVQKQGVRISHLHEIV